MLENVNLKRKISRHQYKELLPALQRRLYELEKACWDNKVPSLVLFEGWDASGKGSAIATLTQRLDPRGFKVWSTQLPRTYEQNYPWLWRFWLKTPDRGDMAIFDGSWYTRVLTERVDRLVPQAGWRAAYRDILEFERMLADDGVAIVKFFLHISRKEQKKRFLKLEADPLEAWRVTPQDWERHRRYDEYAQAAEDMLELTETEYAPWAIVEGTSRWWARKRVFETIIRSLERRLGPSAPPPGASEEAAMREADLRAAMDSLDASRGDP